MAAGDQFGPTVGPWTIEQAVLTLMATPPLGGDSPLLVYYLADQERALGLQPKTLPVPPDPSSFEGGVDAETYTEAQLPTIHVNVEPDGAPTPLDLMTIGQGWQVTVTATAEDDNPDTARMIAGCYGTAIALLLWQNGALGIDATATRITKMPVPEYEDPDIRTICRTQVTISTLTAVALTRPGPGAFQTDPYLAPGAWPTVSEVNVTLDAVTPGT